MGQRVNLNSKFKPRGEDEVKASRKKRKLFKLDPKPNELIMNKYKTAPKYVAIYWEDL